MYVILTTPNRKTFNQMSSKDFKTRLKQKSQNVHFYSKALCASYNKYKEEIVVNIHNFQCLFRDEAKIQQTKIAVTKI